MTDETEKKPETHEEASTRRASELAALTKTHHENVAKAHEDHPLPPGVKFHDLSEADQKRYNEKRAVIDSANKAYNRQVKMACTQHRDEELAERLKFNMAWHKKMADEEAAAPASADASHSSEGMPR